ncbi:MAG: chromosomal replication initiator protein DnaA [Planctomycetota bacterium]
MAEPDERIWHDALAHIRKHASTICRRWFAELRPTGLNGGVVTITAANATQRHYLETRCAEAFDDALRTVTGRLVTARFTDPSNHPDITEPAEPSTDSTASSTIDEAPRGEPFTIRPPVEHEPRSETTEHRHGTLPISPDHALEHFVVGPGNRLAHAAAQAVIEKPGNSYNPLFIYGDVGLGKTHLLQGICLGLIESCPGLRVFYSSCEHFTSRFMQDVRSNRMDAFHKQFRDIDVLALDDIHFLAKRDRTQDEFHHTFNELHNAGKQIILSSDAAPEDIPYMESRLISRFKWGLVAMLAPPAFETRMAIIKEKGRLFSLTIPDAVAEFVASRDQTSVREIEGDLAKLRFYAASAETDVVTHDMAREALGEPVRRITGGAAITVERIIEAVTQHFRVRTSDLQGRNRARSVTLPRQVAMYLAREHTRHSLQEIGGFFGGRDHTTVIHAINKITEELERDEPLRDSVAVLEREIGVRRHTRRGELTRQAEAMRRPDADAPVVLPPNAPATNHRADDRHRPDPDSGSRAGRDA